MLVQLLDDQEEGEQFNRLGGSPRGCALKVCRRSASCIYPSLANNDVAHE